MPTSLKSPDDVVQTSITMERQLKEKYAKLAVAHDLSFSQLVRFALRFVEQHPDEAWKPVPVPPKEIS